MAANCNFATWNPGAKVNPGLSYSGSIFDKANTRFRGNTGGTSSATSTISMKSGKWYVELYAENNPNGGWPTLGLLKTSSISIMQNVSNYQGYTSATVSHRSEIVGTNGNINAFGSTSGASVGGSAWADGDIVQIAVDIDAGKWWFGKNNTYFNSGNPAAGTGQVDTFTAGTEMSIWVASYNGSSYMHINAGQSSQFNGNKTSGSANATDGNGFGDFYYTPPTGFNALCQGNVAIDDDIDPAQTDNDFIGGKQFAIATWTGDGVNDRAISLGMQPDLIVIKERGSANNWYWIDSTRGINNSLQSNTDGGTHVDTGIANAFTSTGFTLGTSGGSNNSSDTYCGWGWRCNGGTTASNSSGSITSTVQANAEAGFSIITYTGNGSAGATIGHGLGKAPEFFLIKRLSSQQTWAVYSVGLGATKNVALNNNNAVATGTAWFNDTEPSATLITIGTEGRVNQNGGNYVCYAWTSIPGFSSFGSYNGTGNTQGAFVYTGFRPKLVMLKRTDGAGSYLVSDATRRPFNDEDYREVYWNDTSSEQTGTNTHDGVDYLSNGFRLRGTNLGSQGSNNDYIYSAWGDIPFRYSNPF